MSGIIPRNTSRAGIVADLRFVGNISISFNSLARVVVVATSSYLIYTTLPGLFRLHPFGQVGRIRMHSTGKLPIPTLRITPGVASIIRSSRLSNAQYLQDRGRVLNGTHFGRARDPCEVCLRFGEQRRSTYYTIENVPAGDQQMVG